MWQILLAVEANNALATVVYSILGFPSSDC